MIKTTLLLLSVLTKVNVIFVSETARSITLKKFNSERIHVVHNWMIARNISEGKQLLDKKIHAILNENVLRLAYIGRITRSKGVHVLVESLVELKKSKFEFTCVFAGGIGHELNEVKYVESINKCIKENNIDSYVKFVGELEDVNDIYSTAHIVVIPSLCIESFGLVAIEAMAFGCIAMSSEIGGLKEIVKTGETGFLFKPGNASELAESIIYCKNNRSECADIIRCAQKDVENRFNAERQLKMIRTIVDSA